MRSRLMPCLVVALLLVTSVLFAGPPASPRVRSFLAPADMVLVPAHALRIGLCEEDLATVAELGRDVPRMSATHATWWFADETPCHEVRVDSFLIDRAEVTNAQFSVFESVSGYRAEGPWRDHLSADRLHHPVVDVTWNDARAYAEWAGKRLPTEAEWEAAARAGCTTRFFWWGDEPDEGCAHWRSHAESFFEGVSRLFVGRSIGTFEVGLLPPNPFGVYDMLGNASEWCADAYAPYPGYTGPDWVFTEHGPFVDGEPRLQGRVVRGGNWDSPDAVFVRFTHRTAYEPSRHGPHIGFRCVRTVGSSAL